MSRRQNTKVNRRTPKEESFAPQTVSELHKKGGSEEVLGHFQGSSVCRDTNNRFVQYQFEASGFEYIQLDNESGDIVYAQRKSRYYQARFAHLAGQTIATKLSEGDDTLKITLMPCGAQVVVLNWGDEWITIAKNEPNSVYWSKFIRSELDKIGTSVEYLDHNHSYLFVCCDKDRSPVQQNQLYLLHSQSRIILPKPHTMAFDSTNLKQFNYDWQRKTITNLIRNYLQFGYNPVLPIASVEARLGRLSWRVTTSVGFAQHQYDQACDGGYQGTFRDFAIEHQDRTHFNTYLSLQERVKKNTRTLELSEVDAVVEQESQVEAQSEVQAEPVNPAVDTKPKRKPTKSRVAKTPKAPKSSKVSKASKAETEAEQ